jgi:hypothetical protein
MAAQIKSASGPPSNYSGSKSLDPRYIVTLTVSGDGGEAFKVSTSLDETLAIGLSSQWSAPFENVMQEAAAGAAEKSGMGGRVTGGASAGMQALGLKAKYRDTSFQTWQSSDPVRFTIPFTLVAVKSAKADIKDKVVNLLKLVAPTQFGPILKAPGPVMLELVSSGRNITLEIGNFLKLEKCVVNDVQVQFDNVIGEEGIPLRAKVNVDISSWYTCFTTQDIDALFLNG